MTKTKIQQLKNFLDQERPTSLKQERNFLKEINVTYEEYRKAVISGEIIAKRQMVHPKTPKQLKGDK